jgi:hypothetical protein
MKVILNYLPLLNAECCNADFCNAEFHCIAFVQMFKPNCLNFRQDRRHFDQSPGPNVIKLFTAVIYSYFLQASVCP